MPSRSSGSVVVVWFLVGLVAVAGIVVGLDRAFFSGQATCGGSFEMVVMSHLVLHRAGRHMSP